MLTGTTEIDKAGGININKRSFGNQGEDAASDFLKNSGYVVQCRNFRYRRLGEIDIIATQGEYICFIEVKSRTGNSFGQPGEAVDYRKRRTIQKIAQIYLLKNGGVKLQPRFDVIEVWFNTSREVVTNIVHIDNAF